MNAFFGVPSHFVAMDAGEERDARRRPKMQSSLIMILLQASFVT